MGLKGRKDKGRIGCESLRPQITGDCASCLQGTFLHFFESNECVTFKTAVHDFSEERRAPNCARRTLVDLFFVVLPAFFSKFGECGRHGGHGFLS